MQPITKKDLLNLINDELKKYSEHDGKTFVMDIEQNSDKSFEYKIDVVEDDFSHLIYCKEVTGFIAPIFDEKFLLID